MTGTHGPGLRISRAYVHGVMYGEAQTDSGNKLAKEGEYLPLI